ncbi:MAG: protein-glutamate O-methyltransferase CheR [Syntrophales bacterium]|nr:protein-glutamate O-methyltransferase CheR [Syntrophales bacterium]
MLAIELNDNDFEKISRLVYEQCGIHLHEGKRELVKARLGKRLREGNFKSFSDYCRHVTTDQGTDELIAMIDSISTNLTYFFREDSHFTALRLALPQLIEGRNRMRIWSAGCSTGEEPYSLAMAVREALGNTVGISILATDISTRVLKSAANGIYTEDKTNRIPPEMLRKYFQYGTGGSTGLFKIKKALRDLIEFKRFNLMHPLPADFRFQVIFCRNVMIYFDKKTQNDLINRFYTCLENGGYLFVGHSESLTGLTHAFQYMEPSIYKK